MRSEAEHVLAVLLLLQLGVCVVSQRQDLGNCPSPQHAALPSLPAPGRQAAPLYFYRSDTAVLENGVVGWCGSAVDGALDFTTSATL